MQLMFVLTHNFLALPHPRIAGRAEDASQWLTHLVYGNGKDWDRLNEYWTR